MHSQSETDSSATSVSAVNFRDGQGRTSGNPGILQLAESVTVSGKSVSLLVSPLGKSVTTLKPLKSRTGSRHKGRFLDIVLKWTLPGHGMKGKACGVLFFLGCLLVDNPGHHGKAWVKPKKSSCDRRECPDCSKAWARKRAYEAARRMVRGLAQVKRGKACHVIVSPPQDVKSDTVGDYRRLRSQAMAALKWVGYGGGCLIFHPWRCRFSDGSRAGGVMLQRGGTAVVGPHFHAVVVGWNEKTDVLYKQTGWVIKRKRVLTDERDIRGVIAYALEHCGCGDVEKKVERAGYVQALTWFGSMDYRALKLDPEPDEIEPCPLCGAPIARVKWVNTLADPPPLEENVGQLVDASDWASDDAAVWAEAWVETERLRAAAVMDALKRFGPPREVKRVRSCVVCGLELPSPSGVSITLNDGTCCLLCDVHYGFFQRDFFRDHRTTKTVTRIAINQKPLRSSGGSS
jgi:hypothetical protein